ncbi:MAG: ABC transporter ATP-binding protein [Desulfovibrionales bacterium]|nr:MAG: ABC transporter ATP-binding protein [Desulfovibrionales bacterium]
MPSAPIAALKHVTRRYRVPNHGEGAVHAGVRDISANIPAGAFALLKGASGSGKTTLLSLIGGMDRPDSGSLHVAGTILESAADHELDSFRRRKVGFVFQTFNLLPTLSVLENAVLPAILDRRTEARAKDHARNLLTWLGLEHRLHHTPDQLSGGEMQRTAIARALLNDPPLILADEPTGNLDSRSAALVIDLLLALVTDQGRTVIMATHSDQADAVASLVLRLHDGELCGDACPNLSDS